MIDRTQSSLSVEGKSKEADSLARKPSTDSDKDLRAVNVVTNVSEESKHSSGRQTYSFYVFSPDNAVRQVLGKLRGTTLYQLSMGATTLACALFVFLKPASKSVDVHAADVVFCVIFVFDVLSGTVAMGILKYWRHDIFHKIDFVTTLLYAVELALKTIGFTYSFKPLRLFRLFNPMLKSRALAGINAIFFSVVHGASSLISILLLLGLALLVLDVVGVEFYMRSARRRCVWMDTLELVLPEKMCKRLYSGEMSSCDLLQSCLDFGNPKDGLLSFDNSWHGFLTVFQVASGDNSYYVLHAMLDAEPTLYVGTILYFLVISLTISLVVLQMFTAVLTNFFLDQVREGFSGDTRQLPDDKQKQNIGPDPAGTKVAPGAGGRMDQARIEIMQAWTQQTSGGEEEGGQGEGQVEGETQQRKEGGSRDLSKVVESNSWLLSVDVLIVINTICLCWFSNIRYHTLSATSDDDSTSGSPSLAQVAISQLQVWLVNVLDVCTVLFICEMVLRILVAGSLSKFFELGQNLFDFVVTSISSLGILVQLLGVSSNSVEALRSLAVLRVLRVMMAFKGTRRLMTAVSSSLTSVRDLLVFILIIFFMLSVAGRDLFVLSLPSRFGDFRTSFLTLAAVFVSDAWSDLMWEAAAARCLTDSELTSAGAPGEEEQPLCSNPSISQPIGAGFFVLFFFICQFVFVALFVAVILEKFDGLTSEDVSAPPTHMEEFISRIILNLRSFLVFAADKLRIRKKSRATLFIRVLEAHDVVPSTLVEQDCNTFCRVRVGSSLCQTWVYPNAFSPSWEMLTPFEFRLPASAFASGECSVHFEVLNTHVTDMYEHLGEATMRLSHLRSDPFLKTRDGEQTPGTLTWEEDSWLRLQVAGLNGVSDDGKDRATALKPPDPQSRSVQDIVDNFAKDGKTRHKPSSNRDIGCLRVHFRLEEHTDHTSHGGWFSRAGRNSLAGHTHTEAGGVFGEVLATKQAQGAGPKISVHDAEHSSFSRQLRTDSQQEERPHHSRHQDVHVSGQKMGIFEQAKRDSRENSEGDSDEEDDEDEEDEEDDGAIKAPHALGRKGPRGLRGLRFRVSMAGREFLMSMTFRSVIYGVVLLDALMLLIGDKTSKDSALYMQTEMRTFLLILVDLIFWMEFMLKLICFGAMGSTNTKFVSVELGIRVMRVGDPYFAHRWNRLDFMCLLSSVKTLLEAVGQGSSRLPTLLMTALSFLRCLRPVRLVTRSPSMRMVVSSLARAMSSVVRVLVFIMLVYLIFAVIGSGLFGGRFHRCSDPSVVNWPLTTIQVPTDKIKCIGASLTVDSEGDFLRPRTWWKPNSGFDDIGESMITLLKVGTLKWLSVLNDAMAITDMNRQPQPGHSYESAIFFVVFILCGSYFCISLFIAVIIDSFFTSSSPGESDSNSIEWLSMQRLIMKAQPHKSSPQPPWNAGAALCRRILESKAADASNVTMIMSNFIFLICNNADPSPAFRLAYYLWSSFYFTTISLQLLLALIGYGLRLCSSDMFLLADVLVVVWAAGATLMTGSLKAAVTCLRIFRVPRLLERLGLYKRSDMYHAVVESLTIAIPQLSRILYLLVLLLLIVASFTVQIFSDIKAGSRLSRTANFRNVFAAFLTLMQVVFGDEWHQIMDDCSIEAPLCTSISDNITLDGKPFDDCGVGTTRSILIFLPFKVIAEWIVINLVTGMLVNCFSFCAAKHDASKAILANEFVEQLQHVWLVHDHSRRGYIQLDKLYAFMRECPLPLGLGFKDDYVKKFLPVRCELAVIAQHRNRAKKEMMSSAIVTSMISLESRLIECQLLVLGGIELLPPGQRIFMAVQDWPNLRGNKPISLTRQTLRMRAGDLVQADGNRWMTSMESTSVIFVPVVCNGRKGSVPSSILRWLRMPGELDDTFPFREVNPEFAGVQYTKKQCVAVLVLQCWGRGVIAKQHATRLRQTKLVRERSRARQSHSAIGARIAVPRKVSIHNRFRQSSEITETQREMQIERPIIEGTKLDPHLQESVRTDATLHVAGSSFGNRARVAAKTDEDVETDSEDDDDPDEQHRVRGGEPGAAIRRSVAVAPRSSSDERTQSLSERMLLSLNVVQLRVRHAVVGWMVRQWYGDMADSILAPSDAVLFSDVISAMAYWHNQDKCPVSQRKRRRKIDDAVRHAKAILLIRAYVTGWRQRRLRRKMKEQRLREEERQRVIAKALARQRAAELDRRRKMEEQENLDKHVNAAVKELREESDLLRQKARSVSTENELLMFSLQDRERALERLQAELKDQQISATRAQAQAAEDLLAAKGQREMQQFQELQQAQRASPHSLNPQSPDSLGADHREERAASPLDAPLSRGGTSARNTGPLVERYSSKPASASLQGQSPWKREKAIVQEIEHHRQAIHSLSLQRTVTQFEQKQHQGNSAHLRTRNPQRAAALEVLREETGSASRHVSRVLDLATTAGANMSSVTQKSKKTCCRSNPSWNAID